MLESNKIRELVADRRPVDVPRSGINDDADLGAALRKRAELDKHTPALPSDSEAVAVEDERRKLIAYARSQDAVLPNLIARGAYRGLLCGAAVQLGRHLLFGRRR